MKFEQGRVNNPYFICVYGTPGVGKSSLCSFAEEPFFIDVESGTKKLDVKRVTEIKSYEEFIKVLHYCRDHEQMQKYKTFVIDTADFLEKLIHEKVVEEFKESSIAKIGYGKGYEAANEYWFKIFDLLDEIRSKDKNIIFIAHEQIKRYESPNTEGYDRYSLKLHNKIANFIFAKCDAVFFMSRDILVSHNDKKIIAKTKPGRKIYAQEQAFVVAKNRYGLPAEITLTEDNESYKNFFTHLN